MAFQFKQWIKVFLLLLLRLALENGVAIQWWTLLKSIGQIKNFLFLVSIKIIVICLERSIYRCLSQLSPFYECDKTTLNLAIIFIEIVINFLFSKNSNLFWKVCKISIFYSRQREHYEHTFNRLWHGAPKRNMRNPHHFQGRSYEK